MDAARRSPPSRNPRRPVLPHLPYVSPPPQDRLFPEQLSSETLAAAANGQSGALAQFLSDRIAGLSPLAGRELAFRATGAPTPSAGDVDWPARPRQRAGVHGGRRQPTLAANAGHRGRAPLAFAPVPPGHLEAAGADWCRSSDLGGDRRVLRAPGRGRPGAGAATSWLAERRALLAPLERAMQDHSSGASRRSNISSQSGHGHREPLRRGGEQILAHHVDLPLGSTELAVDGERFELDPRLTAVENAQAYFARYRKAREAEERVPCCSSEAAQQRRAPGRSAHAGRSGRPDGSDPRLAARSRRGNRGQPWRRTAGRPKTRRVTARYQGAHGQPSRRPRHIAASSLGDGWEALLGTSAAGNARSHLRPWLSRRTSGCTPGACRAPTSSCAPTARRPPEAVLERAASSPRGTPPHARLGRRSRHRSAALRAQNPRTDHPASCATRTSARCASRSP